MPTKWGAGSTSSGSTSRVVVTQLPGSAADGDEIYYQADAAAGVVWHLRFNGQSPSQFKWEFLGGQALYAEVLPNEGTPGGAPAYGAIATAGPSITVPLAGDYDVEIGAGATPFNGTSQMSYDIGATPAVDADAALFREDGANASGFSASRKRRKTALAAATALVAKYKSPNGITIFFGNRYMKVTPVRVG